MLISVRCVLEISSFFVLLKVSLCIFLFLDFILPVRDLEVVHLLPEGDLETDLVGEGDLYLDLCLLPDSGWGQQEPP